MISPYVMAACQPATQVIFGADGRLVPEMLDANVEHYCRLVEKAVDAREARLVVFPQFGLSGYAPGLTIADWIAASLTFPGRHSDRLGRTARQTGAHIVFHATEAHATFPGRYFSAGALITPDGDLALVHRKSYALTTKTRPIDVYDQFAQVLPDGLFPVARTELGTIGVCIAGEIFWPESARSLALKGAEIICNPTASPKGHDYMDRAGAAAVRPSRAFENSVYLAMANTSGSAIDTGGPYLPAPSEIFDYAGASIGVAPPGADQIAYGLVDIEALRRHRTISQANFIAQLQPRIHEDPAGEANLWPVNAFTDAPVADLGQLTGLERDVWNRLVAAGRAIDPA